ncbi:MAG: right-handed parallel beta-helix repeat-containing protein [Candidatus Thorarchaeota archaeon]
MGKLQVVSEYCESRQQEESDVRTNRFAATTLLLSVLVLSFTANIAVTTNQFGLKTITLNLNSETIPAQTDREPMVLTSNADFALLGATGVGTPSDPYTFDGLRIQSTDTCIRIQNTTAYFVISNSFFETDNSVPAIEFDNVENGRVEQCVITGGSNGVIFYDSLDCEVIDCIIYSCYYGVTFINTSNSSIVETNIHNNEKGILMEHSDHVDIVNNSIYSSTDFGLEVAFYSHNNSIYGNDIGWNNSGDENVLDSGADNVFDDGVSVGNRWTDFNGTEPFTIPGTGGSVDNFAQLLEDTTNPVLSELLDMAIDVDSVGNTVTWSGFDEFPESYILKYNDLNVESAVWNGYDITYNLDELEVGTHIIKLEVYDGAGNMASDEILVSVVSFVLGGIGTELVMIASAVTVVSFLIIVVLIKKLS